MKNLIYISFLILFCSGFLTAYAQPTPPSGKKWVKIEALSDEFDGNSLNTAKWADNDPQWRGRVPGLFKPNAIKVQDGNLQITNYILSSPEGSYTHGCGLVRSRTRNLYGYYECRMKASRTFMSSTFWLFNKRNEGSGCDVRTTELDITETVGFNSNGANWVNTNMRSMNSNTHSRGTTCNSTPVGMEGGKADLGGQSWEDYHTYGVWWKSATELLFYLDGTLAFQITPPANFNLPMYLRMVTETYDWNPVPSDGGLTGSAESRTTYYDWVHTFKLENEDGTPTPPMVDEVAFSNAPTTINPQASYTFDISYTASTDREIMVEFWSSTNWLAGQKETVSAGTGVKSITVTLPNIPQPGTGYIYKTHIRPLGTDWQAALANDQINNVTIEESLGVGEYATVDFAIYPNPTQGKLNFSRQFNNGSYIEIYDLYGKKVFSQKLNTNSIDLTGLSSGIYLTRFIENDRKYISRIVIK